MPFGIVSFWPHVLSWHNLGSALAEKVGQLVGGGWVPALADSAWWRLQLPVEKVLVNDGWAICLPSCTNGCRKCSFHLVGIPFLAFYAAFSLEERALVRGP